MTALLIVAIAFIVLGALLIRSSFRQRGADAAAFEMFGYVVLLVAAICLLVAGLRWTLDPQGTTYTGRGAKAGVSQGAAK